MNFEYGYKTYKQFLGCSDIAALTLTGWRDGGLKPYTLNRGMDGSYSAWVIDQTIDVPSHYSEECEFCDWMRVFDDDGRQATFRAEKIKVFTAGEMGILIQLINPDDSEAITR